VREGNPPVTCWGRTKEKIRGLGKTESGFLTGNGRKAKKKVTNCGEHAAWKGSQNRDEALAGPKNAPKTERNL